MNATAEKVAHTPGPWRMGSWDNPDKFRAEIEIDANYVTEYGRVSCCIGTAFGEANARLVIAAPELGEELLKKHSYLCADPQSCSTCQVLQKAGLL